MVCVDRKSTSPHLRGNNQLWGLLSITYVVPIGRGGVYCQLWILQMIFGHWIGLDWNGNRLVGLVIASQAN